MYTVYAIRSINHDYTYVGTTADLEGRVREHNTGLCSSTRSRAPYRVIYTEVLPARLAARQREKFWQSKAGKEKLRAIT